MLFSSTPLEECKTMRLVCAISVYMALQMTLSFFVHRFVAPYACACKGEEQLFGLPSFFFLTIFSNSACRCE